MFHVSRVSFAAAPQKRATTEVKTAIQKQLERATPFEEETAGFWKELNKFFFFFFFFFFR